VLERRLQTDAGFWNGFVKVCGCGKEINGRRTIEVTDHFEELQDKEARVKEKKRGFLLGLHRRRRDFAKRNGIW
jgi:hypothetical protein